AAQPMIRRVASSVFVAGRGSTCLHPGGAMRSMLIGLSAAALLIGVTSAQSRINPTDPQPTCAMCPAVYIPASELAAYTKKAVAEQLTDQQVRDVEIGKAHVGI